MSKLEEVSFILYFSSDGSYLLPSAQSAYDSITGIPNNSSPIFLKVLFLYLFEFPVIPFMYAINLFFLMGLYWFFVSDRKYKACAECYVIRYLFFSLVILDDDRTWFRVSERAKVNTNLQEAARVVKAELFTRLEKHLLAARLMLRKKVKRLQRHCMKVDGGWLHLNPAPGMTFVSS